MGTEHDDNQYDVPDESRELSGFGDIYDDEGNVIGWGYNLRIQEGERTVFQTPAIDSGSRWFKYNPDARNGVTYIETGTTEFDDLIHAGTRESEEGIDEDGWCYNRVAVWSPPIPDFASWQVEQLAEALRINPNG